MACSTREALECAVATIQRLNPTGSSTQGTLDVLNEAIAREERVVAVLTKLAGERDGFSPSHEITCRGLQWIPGDEREHACNCGHAEARAILAGRPADLAEGEFRAGDDEVGDQCQACDHVICWNDVLTRIDGYVCHSECRRSNPNQCDVCGSALESHGDCSNPTCRTHVSEGIY